MQNRRGRRWLGFSTIALVLPHLFCCVLPATLAVIGLMAPVSAEMFHDIMPEWLEFILFAISGIMLAASWIITWRDCPCEHCHDDKCDTGNEHKIQKTITIIATILFAITLCMHFCS
jgi:ABC-type Fe3+ transport system permease subunit